MIHHAGSSFWKLYEELPQHVQEIADKNYELLKQNPNHPSLHFKKIKNYYSVRVGLYYRALGISKDDSVIWFWIGSHSEYDKFFR